LSCAGFAVAGGRSRRMGRDKADLPFGPGTLLDHALARLRAVAGRVHVLCGAEPRYLDRGVPVLLDARVETGPLAGLETALASLATGEVALLLGVDMPLVPVTLLEELVRRSAGADVVVPVSAQGPEPMAAVYSAGAGPALRRALEAGDRRMTSFWPSVRVERVQGDDLARFCDPEHAFLNVNTPEDYERVLTIGGWVP
jgi:molybdopterin-guanine dinucleotide biosynthesis protein A